MEFDGRSTARYPFAAARHSWDSDAPYQAGRAIFEYIPIPDRRRWAADMVEIVYPLIPPSPVIEAVLDLARQDARWEGADHPLHLPVQQVVYAVRAALHADHEVQETILALIYNAAKAICNSRYPAVLFDHDAAWRVVVYAKALVSQLQQPGLAERLWLAISNRHYIQLDDPQPCHPGCPFCVGMYGRH